MLQYQDSGNNLRDADNPQATKVANAMSRCLRDYTRSALKKGEDIVRPMQRCIEIGRNDQSITISDVTKCGNCHGGVVKVLLAPGEEFYIIGAATETLICCRNSVGTGTSTYVCTWQED